MKVNLDKLDSLPLSQRLQLLEALIDTLADEHDFLVSPNWHLDELKKRQNELNKPSTWVSLEDVKRSLILR